MFVPETYYIFKPEKWQEQVHSPLAMLFEKTTKRGDTALAAHRDGLVVAYRAHNRFVRLVPVAAWREYRD